MTRDDFNRRNRETQEKLMYERIDLERERTLTEREWDIYKLKEIRYSIGYGSRWFRYGYIAALDRAIKILEKME
ncbi:hypothetical protein AGMMS49975_20800 [Clostridia bacterium]|nr:hypothetical protein AGMMS49975_20800 [Clostridia bacterium]